MTTPNIPKLIIDFEAEKPDWNDDDISHYHQLTTEFATLKIKAMKRALEDKLTSYYKKLIDEEMYEHFPSSASDVLNEVHKLKTITDNITDVKNGKNEYCFYTVNFKPEFDKKFEEIDELVHSFATSQKYIKDNFCYAIEQRSEGDVPVGVHCHILFKKGENSPSKIQRAFKNKFFDKYVGTPACLDYRYINDYKEKLKYILGIKEKSKMPKVYHDRKIRETLGLPHYRNISFDDEINEIKKSASYIERFENKISLYK